MRNSVKLPSQLVEGMKVRADAGAAKTPTTLLSMILSGASSPCAKVHGVSYAESCSVSMKRATYIALKCRSSSRECTVSEAARRICFGEDISLTAGELEFGEANGRVPKVSDLEIPQEWNLPPPGPPSGAKAEAGSPAAGGTRRISRLSEGMSKGRDSTGGGYSPEMKKIRENEDEFFSGVYQL